MGRPRSSHYKAGDTGTVGQVLTGPLLPEIKPVLYKFPANRPLYQVQLDHFEPGGAGTVLSKYFVNKYGSRSRYINIIIIRLSIQDVYYAIVLSLTLNTSDKCD